MDVGKKIGTYLLQVRMSLRLVLIRIRGRIRVVESLDVSSYRILTCIRGRVIVFGTGGFASEADRSD